MKREPNARILNTTHRVFREAVALGLVELRRQDGHAGDHRYGCCDVFQLFLCWLSGCELKT
jgi:hypothetical protein